MTPLKVAAGSRVEVECAVCESAYEIPVDELRRGTCPYCEADETVEPGPPADEQEDER